MTRTPRNDYTYTPRANPTGTVLPEAIDTGTALYQQLGALLELIEQCPHCRGEATIRGYATIRGEDVAVELTCGQCLGAGTRPLEDREALLRRAAGYLVAQLPEIEPGVGADPDPENSAIGCIVESPVSADGWHPEALDEAIATQAAAPKGGK